MPKSLLVDVLLSCCAHQPARESFPWRPVREAPKEQPPRNLSGKVDRTGGRRWKRVHALPTGKAAKR